MQRRVDCEAIEPSKDEGYGRLLYTLLSLLLGDQQEMVPEEEGHEEQDEQKNTANRGLDNRNIRVRSQVIRNIRSEKEGFGFEG